MLQVLIVTFPFFALVLCGYLAARWRLLPLDAVPGLNMFVLYFALPCMLFRLGSRTPLAQLFDPLLALLWLSSAALLGALVVALARRQRRPWPDAALGALVAVFPNSGFMGVPLLIALLGPSAAGPLMPTLLLDLVVTSSLCIALTQWGAASDHGAARAALQALRGVARNPMPWSVLLGAAASGLALPLPGPLERTVALLADAASPVALFTIGAVLARAQQAPAAARPAGDATDVAAIAFIKLLAHPLLVGALGLAAMRAGWLSPLAQQVLTLVAALPSASNVSLLAERYGADNGRIARIVLWTTALAFLSFSAVVGWVL